MKESSNAYYKIAKGIKIKNESTSGDRIARASAQTVMLAFSIELGLKALFAVFIISIKDYTDFQKFYKKSNTDLHNLFSLYLIIGNGFQCIIKRHLCKKLEMNREEFELELYKCSNVFKNGRYYYEGLEKSNTVECPVFEYFIKELANIVNKLMNEYIPESSNLSLSLKQP